MVKKILIFLFIVIIGIWLVHYAMPLIRNFLDTALDSAFQPVQNALDQNP